MRALPILLAVCAVIVATPTPASAQDANARFLQQPASDATVDEVLAFATANLSLARGDDGQPLPPLNDEQQAQPLLTRELVREVIDIAFASAIGELCGLDWARGNFVPLMLRERARGDRTQHQLASIALAHGLVQNQVTSGGQCGANGRASASAFYQRKWGAPARE